ncbi:sulfotransferase [Pseudoxanthomonas sp. PXM02]|uniref:tetratricopeptide repeat-containing sulfotransferase family protein n=1 Tax=Pseudoxanthomonas sp. PXM02 TaxID=2769294 RepID=UPI001CE14A7D|nr:sulfotransferase [Pseudoxanthomonas sp. PXM02]
MSDAPALPAALADAWRRRDWGAMERLAMAWLQARPDDVPVRFALGVALLERQRAQAAAAQLQRVTELAPGHADAWAQHARALSLLQRPAEAVVAADRALALAPRDARTLDALGVVYSRANAHVRAVALFRHAVSVMPTHAAYRYNLASSLTFCGEFDAAEQEYEACLAQDPLHWRAHSSLSRLRRQTPESNHLQRLHAVLAETGGDADAQLHVHHALFKEYEDLGDHAHAFSHLQAGKHARRGVLDYRPERDAALFDALREAFPVPIPSDEGHDSREPLFVVGLPRTGTTLVERILSSHPQVHAAGELQNFGVLLKRASGSATRHLLDPDTIRRASALDWRKLGADYVASTRPDTGGTAHFIDKLPHNFLYAAYIARALPRARIVCLRRHPLDSCLSNFRQLFALNTPYFDYANDLLDTGRYYLHFDRLVAHWREILPERLLEVAYEDIVSEPEIAARRLLAFCGLPWDDACLDFHQNPQPVATASAVQVRQPLYRSALGRWRHYAPQLSDLRRLLEAGGVETGGSLEK